MARVTIVVPTYNVEAYIQACLDSLVSQTSHDFVALIINDGSPANEQAIIDRYVKNYPFIQSIQKTNGGYGSVLNRAALECSTPYFMICDPDDTLRNDAVEVLLNKMDETQADLLIGAKTLVYSDNHQTQYDPSFNPEFAQLKDNVILQKGTPGFDQLFFVEPSPHAKLYRTDTVKKIRFPEKVSYTDNVLYYLSILQAQRVSYTSEALSNYLINREGNTRTDLRPTVMDAWMTVLNSILDQSQAIHDIPAMFYFRLFESFKFVFTKIDSIQGDSAVLTEKLYSTQTLLNRLLPYHTYIEPILKKQSYQSTKLKKLDLDLINPQTSDKTFHRWADYQLQRKLQGGVSLKQKIKNQLETLPLISNLFKVYQDEVKYLYALLRPRVILHPKLKLHVLDPKGQTFFGYYTRSPYRNGHYAYHRIQSKSISLKQTVEIVVDGKKISESNAWNWQQGSMLQWLDDENLIFNDYRNQQYVSVIVNIHTQHETIIPFPIYSISSEGDFALSLNYKRLAKYRPDYGYFNEPFIDVADYDENDGIYWVDLNTKTQKLWLSFKDLTALQPKPSMNQAIHKVNHLDISPDNTQVIFLHRWIKDGIKYTRLIKANLQTNELSIVADYDMISHCAWLGQEIIAYLRDPLKGDRYFLIGSESKVILNPLLDDGHPSVSSTQSMCVTDAYPNYLSMSSLYLALKPFDQAFEIAQFYSGRRFKGTQRCDLHPRFSPHKSEVTLDTVYQGKRQCIALDVSAWETLP